MGGGNGYFVLSNNLGLWLRLNCFDDTLEKFYISTITNFDYIIDLSENQYKMFIEQSN
jgi:hypothetical protein